jgi:hypothetical protein
MDDFIDNVPTVIWPGPRKSKQASVPKWAWAFLAGLVALAGHHFFTFS